MEKDTKKSKINLQFVNVSGEKTEITDQIFHNILIWKIGRKRKKLEVFDFINVRGQQTFEENEIDPIGI